MAITTPKDEYLYPNGGLDEDIVRFASLKYRCALNFILCMKHYTNMELPYEIASVILIEAKIFVDEYMARMFLLERFPNMCNGLFTRGENICDNRVWYGELGLKAVDICNIELVRLIGNNQNIVNGNYNERSVRSMVSDNDVPPVSHRYLYDCHANGHAHAPYRYFPYSKINKILVEIAESRGIFQLQTLELMDLLLRCDGMNLFNFAIHNKLSVAQYRNIYIARDINKILIDRDKFETVEALLKYYNLNSSENLIPDSLDDHQISRILTITIGLARKRISTEQFLGRVFRVRCVENPSYIKVLKTFGFNPKNYDLQSAIDSYHTSIYISHHPSQDYESIVGDRFIPAFLSVYGEDFKYGSEGEVCGRSPFFLDPNTISVYNTILDPKDRQYNGWIVSYVKHGGKLKTISTAFMNKCKEVNPELHEAILQSDNEIIAWK